MIKFLRWCKGYVRFEAEVADLTGGIHQMRKEGIRVWRLAANGPFLAGYVRASHYRRLAKLLHRYGGRIKVVKRKGLPFFTFRHRRRWGFVVGCVVATAFLGYTQLFLWDIRIAEEGTAEDRQALQALLTAHGVVKGALLSELHAPMLQEQMMLANKEFAWIALNFSGTVVEVEFQPRDQQPTLYPDTPCDVVAKKAGQIRYVEALYGTEVVKEGEVVLPGDLLISSIVVGDHDPIHAGGRVLAETIDQQTRQFSLTQQEKSFTGKQQFRLTISFFGVTFPIWDHPPEALFETTTKRKEVSLFGSILPIWIEIDTFSIYEWVTVQYTEEEAKQWLLDAFLQYEKEVLSEATLLSYKEELQTTDGICSMTRIYRLEEDIAVKQLAQ